MSRLLLALFVTVVACVPAEVGNSQTPSDIGNEEAERRSCGAAASTITPLFEAGPSASGAIVTRRADGVIVTKGAGRVRPRHEREDRHMKFEAHYFEKRSFGFVVEDEVAAGRSSLRVTYRPIFEWADPSPRTNFRAWKVYGEPGNGPQSYLFANNNVLTTVGPLEQTITITTNARERGRPLRVGDIMEFEFGIFMRGFPADDTWAVGAKSYYSDTFRYQVGVGGLTPETFDNAGLVGPVSLDERLGGDTTVPHVAFADGTAVEPAFAFAQMALNIQAPHQQQWLEGRRLFHTDFGTGEHSERGNPAFTEQAGKLGPHFNVRSCQACHPHNGRGVLPAVGAQVDTLVMKLENGGALGTQLQPQEAPLRLAREESKVVTLADGTTVTLRRPVFDAGRALQSSARLPRQLVGLGLLEAIDEATVLASADEDDCDGNGISGRANVIDDPVTGTPRLGRFGWKAEKVSVQHQVADALILDLGVSTSMFPTSEGKAELSSDDLERLTTYMRLIGVVPQRRAAAPEVVRGAQVFGDAGCSGCHFRSTRTGQTHPFEELRGQAARPFTDLLLHDLGAELADDSGRDDASEWRTPPLWGLGLTRDVSGAVNLLHDGRARSVLEAVLWHGGEAQPARQFVEKAPAADRAALIAYLESL